MSHGTHTYERVMVHTHTTQAKRVGESDAYPMSHGVLI